MVFCLDDIARIVAQRIIDILFELPVRCFTARENVRKLNLVTKELESKRNGIQNIIAHAERDGKVATSEVQWWLGGVSTIISEEKDISGKYEQRSIILGSCPLNCLSNYEISRNAAKKHNEATILLNKVPVAVAEESLPPAVRKVPVPSSIGLSTRDAKLQEAIQCIKDESEGMIGIWGLGGVGKTHLLKEIKYSFHGDTSFDHVIFVTASQGCSVEKMQAEIVKNLKLQDDHDVQSQANIISDFLNKRSFLVLLDDIWEEIDLRAVGIPYPLGRCPIDSEDKVRKVVLTTRFRNVCGRMGVVKYINVACLPDDEAWHLFQNKVGLETLSSSPRVEALAKILVGELKGLPLALKTIGNAMHGKGDPIEWEYAIDHMKQSHWDDDDPLSMISVFRQLKFSYDSLRNDTVRQCFLTCSLWPEDWPIDTDELMECWMGLDLVDECDFNRSNRKVHFIIGELKAAGLLESSKDTFVEMALYAKVKMHDIIRDMAIWISCGCGENNDRWVVQAGIGANISGNNIPWSKAECISLMQNRIKELHLSEPIPDPDKLKALYLRDNMLNQETVEAIKVFTGLTYLDLKFNDLINLPAAICCLANLVYLNLSFNQDLRELPECIGKLVKLKFLYLERTSSKIQIPTNIISSLKALQVLDMMYGPAFTLPILQGLRTLENLKAVDVNIWTVSQYKLLSKAVNIPIRSLIVTELGKCSTFCLSAGIFSDDIARRTLYKLDIRHTLMEKITASDDSGKPFESLRFLGLSYLMDLRDIMWKGISSRALFPTLTRLSVEECPNLQHISWAMYLPCLEYLTVDGCENMRQAFLIPKNCPVQESSTGTFPCLKHLEFRRCLKMTNLCDSSVTFKYLESMEFSFV